MSSVFVFIFICLKLSPLFYVLLFWKLLFISKVCLRCDFLPKYTNTCQNAPTTLLPKRPHLFIAKTVYLIFFSTQLFVSSEDYMYHVWCLIIQDLFSKFIYCICIHAYLTSDDNELVYIQVYSAVQRENAKSMMPSRTKSTARGPSQ